MIMLLKKSLRPLAAMCVLLVVSAAIACQVPVFRYALERWASGSYRIYVLSQGDLTDAQKDVVQSLKDQVEGIGQVIVRNAKDKVSNNETALLAAFRPTEKPMIVGFYPMDSEVTAEQSAFQVPLEQKSVAALTQSPVREELIRRLAAGHSAVWLFLKSGQKPADDAALAKLTAQLEKDSEDLRLPGFDELEVSPDLLRSTKVRLKIQFSVIEIDRADPEEHCLVDMLLNSEPDLRASKEPLAFPVFGRGRVLYSLVGEGITSDNIRTATEFIAGPCSCQVKELNPGFDLLLQCDWDDMIGDVMISDPIPDSPSEPVLLKIPPGRKKR
jgi:hypothetical protein